MSGPLRAVDDTRCLHCGGSDAECLFCLGGGPCGAHVELDDCRHVINGED